MQKEIHYKDLIVETNKKEENYTRCDSLFLRLYQVLNSTFNNTLFR